MRLRQSVANLVANAARHTPAGGPIRLSGAPDRIDVDDDDEGIPAGELGTVFERFRRVDPARARGTGGSGLGLAIEGTPRLPAACRPSNVLIAPFPLSGGWPRYRLRDLQTCGPWTVLARPDYLYLGRELTATGRGRRGLSCADGYRDRVERRIRRGGREHA